MQDTIYLKCEQSAKVVEKKVMVKDVAKVYGNNKAAVAKIKSLTITNLHGNGKIRCIISVMKIIETILENVPDIEINNIGETDVLISYDNKSPNIFLKKYVVVPFCCLIVFFGSAFTIMAFNTDVSVNEFFSKFYMQLTGRQRDHITLIEIGYSVGIFIGIGVFYNHFGKKKITEDPTPIEIEMREYETSINTTLIDGVKREGKHLDVN